MALSLVFILLCTVVAHGATVHTARQTPALPLYAPVPGLCPSTDLLRVSSGLSKAESDWLNLRKSNTDPALRQWLSQFGSFPAQQMPTIASSYAGGFLRASMLAAGIRQQMKAGEGVGPMAGLVDAMAYEATLSGSAAFQAGLIQNNWPTISSLSSGLWEPRYATGMKPTPPEIVLMTADVGSKAALGYPVSLVDLYGRIIGYSNLYDNGGQSTHMSGTRDQPKFIAAMEPLPIMTAIVVLSETSCNTGPDGPQIEMTPFEFGSWDKEIGSFMDMKYLGTSMNAGKPQLPLCTTGFDNLGFLTGTTANTLVKQCPSSKGLPGTGVPGVDQIIAQVAANVTPALNQAFFSEVPNPFRGLASATAVADRTVLNLVDGGNSGQVIPLWPLLHRPIDVAFVWDNYYDDDNVATLGTQMYNTYLEAKKRGVTTMPTIPTPAEAQAKGLNKRPTGYGCNDPNVQTYIYVPYTAYVPQTQATFNLTTTPQQTRDYILNGNKLATKNGDPGWPRCVACLVMKKKASSLPSFCQSCFTTYCYN